MTDNTRTLILNGSPRPYGNSAQIIERITPMLIRPTKYDIFKAKLNPCIDCRICHSAQGCAIEDDFSYVLDNSFTHIIIVSPIYMGTLTPPMLSLASRFQADYCAKRFLREPITRLKKRALVVLTGGGDGNHNHAAQTAKMIAGCLGAKADVVMSLNTDNVPAVEDEGFISSLDTAVTRLYDRENA